MVGVSCVQKRRTDASVYGGNNGMVYKEVEN